MPASPALATREPVAPGLLAAPGPALADHLAAHGPLPVADAAHLAATAGPTACFPVVAARIRSVARDAVRVRRAPVVVADGAGREPDGPGLRALLTRAPHLVLDGLALTARTLGATTCVLTAGPDRLPALALALAERGDAVWLQPLTPTTAGEPTTGGSITGEPPVGVPGVAGRPTLVLDAEVLARLALLARGCTGAADRRLVARHWEAAGVPRADVVDVGPGTRLADLLPLGGAQAVLVGGHRGTWVPAATARALTLEQAGLAAGTDVLAALPTDRCGLLETARVLGHLARGPAGPCGTCTEELSRAAAAMVALAAPVAPPPGLLEDVVHRSGPVACRGGCPHPDGTARLVAGALETFADELTAHRYGSCTATAWAPFLPLPAGAG